MCLWVSPDPVALVDVVNRTEESLRHRQPPESLRSAPAESRTRCAPIPSAKKVVTAARLCRIEIIVTRRVV